MVILVVSMFVLASCSQKSDSTTTSTPNPSIESPSQTAQTPLQTSKPVRLVDKLPPGTEGVELAEDGLRILDGYRYMKEKDGTFSIMRMQDGKKTGTSGSCGCRGGGKCTDKGVVIVRCELDTTCAHCEMQVTVGGVSTAIFRY
jgi:hypothetical protein